MNIGKNIAKLRTEYGLSQDILAQRVGISTKTLSDWEAGNSLPPIDMLTELCSLFSIPIEDLINDRALTGIKRQGVEKKTSYFGTDGFRGEANVELTPEHSYKIGRFLGWYYGRAHNIGNSHKRARIIIGKDTRRSSYMLEYSIAAGIAASGADAYMLHVTTTPSVSYVTRHDNFDCGIMITASHNPFYDNGIKIINQNGEKLEDDVTFLIESYLNGDIESMNVTGIDIPLATKDNIGMIVDYVAGINRYLGHLISLASHSYKNLKIGLDCANGASWSIAKAIFESLVAQTYIIGAEPDGLNINKGVGSTHIEQLIRCVKENNLDVGFAFDGDADRCIAVDENGNVIDGDKIIYILAKRLKSSSDLHKDTVAITVMSNLGLIKALSNKNIKCVVTAVGDRFVYQKMEEGGYALGGEQSGHVIIKKYATTGDGILTAIMLTEEMMNRKCKISQLCEDVVLFPQLTESIRVKSKKAVIEDDDISRALKSIESELAGNGRVLLRPSGTEPVIRIMIESISQDTCKKYMDYLKNLIIERGL